ncbi:hypothetical protein F4808DRAFT_459734 [Astrocystis sublimbata]|nr:hypothetical protein F4808DRAFT_459734 [Astrocystis sublimbata]
MQTSFFTTVAALAVTAAAAPALQSRETFATWTTSNIQIRWAGHGPINGAQFDISAPAGYIAGAPAFSGTCDVNYGNHEPNGCAGAEGVSALFDDRVNPGIIVYHNFGNTKAWGNSDPLSLFDETVAIPVTHVDAI